MLEGWNLFYCTEFTDRKSAGSQRSLHLWTVWTENDFWQGTERISHVLGVRLTRREVLMVLTVILVRFKILETDLSPCLWGILLIRLTGVGQQDPHWVRPLGWDPGMKKRVSWVHSSLFASWLLMPRAQLVQHLSSWFLCHDAQHPSRMCQNQPFLP